MIELDWNPDERKLRQFGWISLVGFGLVGALVGWRFGCFAEGRWLVPSVLWGIGVLAALLAASRPAWLRPLYLVLTGFSAVVGPPIAFAVMLLIFAVAFVPIGLFFRWVGRDELKLRPDPEADSYWEPRPPEPEPASYFRQH